MVCNFVGFVASLLTPVQSACIDADDFLDSFDTCVVTVHFSLETYFTGEFPEFDNGGDMDMDTYDDLVALGVDAFTGTYICG